MSSGRTKADDSELSLIGIYEIGKVLGSTLDLDKALHDVLNILSSYLDMRHGVVVLADDEGHPALAAVTGMSLKLARTGALKYPFAAAAKVIATGSPMLVADPAAEPLLAECVDDGDDLDDEGVSFLCVPIKTTDKPFGALSIERPRDAAPQGFERDLRFLTMVGTLIGQTVNLHRKVIADREQLMEDNARLRKQMVHIKPTAPVRGLEDVIGTSPAMAHVFAQVQQAAPSKATVLLRGESGTGKERIAHAIHVLSPRAAKPFVKVNCAALSESVLESELFGHEKGAFTGAIGERKGRFELASGGTLFLDEIGEISLTFQSKLLRVLQEGEFERVGGTKTLKVDVRLVAATNRDLEAAVKKGEFRADLYYRLNVVPIFLPPLRDRPGDIPLLAAHFLAEFNKENGRSLGLTHRALQTLERCAFPGNVRELENCITRTATMAKGEVIDDEAFSCRRETCLSSTLWPHHEHDEPAAMPLPTFAPAPPPPPAADDEADPSERERLIQAMERCGWVQAKAARLLGLTPRQIGYALKKHDIPIREL
ncbi:MAG: nif-specific transcriptional activator NifA [Magnetospirillum sp.]|nr:nif-specific transcriptional activator NifA [Magnetospirillum sp.]